MTTKIALLITDNPYNSTQHFARGLGFALKNQGFEISTYCFKPDCFYQAFYPLLDDPPDLTISFSDITMGKVPLGELWSIPHLSLLLDPALYYLHQCKGKNSLVAHCDRKELAFIHSLDFPTAFFFPHAIDKKLFENQISPHRPYPIVMVGSCIDIDKLVHSWKTIFTKEERDLLFACAEEVLSPKGISCIEALTRRRVYQNLHALHTALDAYVEGKERIDLTRTLQGPHLHVWGRGPWKKYLPQAHCHGPISFTQAQKIFRQAHIVLNPTPRFKDGSHERILLSYASGSLPLTGHNPFIAESFPPAALFTYPHGNYTDIPSRIEQLLHNPTLLQQKVEAGREVVQKNHTWDARVPLIEDGVIR